MKNNLFGICAIVSILCVENVAFGASRSAMYNYDDGMQTVSVKTTRTRTYNTFDNNVNRGYTYNMPARTYRSGMYSGQVSNNESYRTRSTSYNETAKRKYFLAHPFYQPLQGKFGTVTDFSFTNSSYDFDFMSDISFFDGVDDRTFDGVSGDWNADIFAIKEDLSFGITDKIALMGMVKYDSSKYKFTWDDGVDDKMKDSGINFYGLGIQGRIVDTNEWIMMLSGYFEHQKDMANDFIAELKAGYKVSHSTIYGLLRGWLVDIDGNAYGNAVSDDTSSIFFAYNTDVDDIFQIEGGFGVFSVLGEDWTLNLEAIIGNYDWHNQASIKGAIGFQPNDWFALNLYAKTSFYDSAEGKSIDGYYMNPSWLTAQVDGESLDSYTFCGRAKLDNVQEWTIGAQVIFEF